MKRQPRGWVRVPNMVTLKKYGLTELDWLRILERQDWRCPICLRTGAGTTWNIDHDHVPGWKAMTPEQRKPYVRGILCAYCNHRRVNSRMPAVEAQRIADYLAAYEARRKA